MTLLSTRGNHSAAATPSRSKHHESFLDCDTPDRRLMSLLAASPAVTYCCAGEPSYALAFVTSNIEQLSGYSSAELMRSDARWLDCIHPDDWASAIASFKRGIESERFARRFRIKHKNGSSVWVNDECVVSRDDFGTIVGLTGVLTNAAASMEIDTQLQVTHALESIGQMTGCIAHDFNNLLGIIIGNLDLLDDTLRDDPLALNRAHTAMDAALRGSEMTKLLLSTARQQPMELSDYNVSALLLRIVPMLKSSVGVGVSFSSQLCADPLIVKLDATGFNRILVNLVINARDSLTSIDGAKEVTVRTRLKRVDSNDLGLPSGSYAVIDVTDTGCGMTDEVRRNALVPFFTTKAVGVGTGLGLSMVYGYAKQLGGTCEIRSIVGEGTTVSVYLPIVMPRLGRLYVTEQQRLQSLRRHELLDTVEEVVFDRIVEEAADICGTPIALISLVDEHRQWFKAHYGIAVRQTPRDIAFCAHAILRPGDTLVVADASRDPRFSGNPLVTDEPKIRFYAGKPVVDCDGLPLGTLCVIDRVARELTDNQLLALDHLAARVSDLIQARLGSSVASADAIQSASATACVHPPKRILVVDDEEGLRVIAQTWLHSLGYEVMLAGSSAEALNLLEIEKFDILFTDIVMPGSKDGLTLARMARIIDPQISVLVTSGYARELLIDATLPGTFLVKPYRRGELKGALDSLLLATPTVP